MDLAPDRPRASIASTLSSTTNREEKRGFVRSTSHALEKLSQCCFYSSRSVWFDIVGDILKFGHYFRRTEWIYIA